MNGHLSSRWRCISASAIGSSHIAQKLPCQDAHETSVLENGTLIVAVADGAGSARRAEEGSRLATQSSTQYLVERLQIAHPKTPEELEALLEGALKAARTALEQLACGEALKELATTLLLTVVTDRWLSTVQIGDGAVVCRPQSGNLQVLSNKSDSEYINEATFLTSSGYLEHLHRTTLPSNQVSGLAVFSDGIQMLALQYSDNTAHEPFFRAMFEFAEAPTSTRIDLEEFLLSERVCDRTDDDKTLVLAVRNAPH
jgi:serine/threonine protein phosphatase PrpC